MGENTKASSERRLQAIAYAEDLAIWDISGAINEYAEILTSFPDDEAVLHRLAELYAQRDDSASAIYILLRLAIVHERSRDLPKAVAAYKRIIKLDPTRVPAYEELARLYSELRLFYEASEQWRELAAYALRVGDRAVAAKYGKKVQELRVSMAPEPPPNRRAADNPLAELAIEGIPVVPAPVDMVVFLGHASEDKPIVRDLYSRLKADNFQPWFDEEDLIAGQNWRAEVPKAVRRSHAFIVCLSARSTTKAGYLQKEIKFALDVLAEQPEGIIFVIPVRLEPCDVPDSLQHLHYADMFEPQGYGRLQRALIARAKQLGLSKTGPA